MFPLASSLRILGSFEAIISRWAQWSPDNTSSSHRISYQ